MSITSTSCTLFQLPVVSCLQKNGIRQLFVTYRIHTPGADTQKVGGGGGRPTGRYTYKKIHLSKKLSSVRCCTAMLLFTSLTYDVPLYTPTQPLYPIAFSLAIARTTTRTAVYITNTTYIDISEA